MTLNRIKNHVLVSLSWISTVQYLFIKMTIYSFVGGLTNGDTRVEKNIVSGINCVYIMGFSKNRPYPHFVEDIHSQKLYPSGIPSKLSPPPEIFHCFFPFHLLEFHQNSYHPLEFSCSFSSIPGIFKIQNAPEFCYPQLGWGKDSVHVIYVRCTLTLRIFWEKYGSNIRRHVKSQ